MRVEACWPLERLVIFTSIAYELVFVKP
jgi:hypothetical protein